MTLRTQFVITFALLIAVVLVFDATALDVWVQNHFYDATALDKPALQRWMVYKYDKTSEFWFHRTAKVAVEIFGGLIFVFGVLGFFAKPLSPYRYRFLFLPCAMLMVALLVGGAKHFTNTYCPNQTVLYGGDKPYMRLLEPYPADFHPAKKGKCFPAGHATAGFGLMALYFMFIGRKIARRVGLAVGLGMGWTLGIFQMIRGEHFLSHTLFTMVASWLVILLTHQVFETLAQRER